MDKRAYIVLTLSTLAFAVCFAAWMMNGVLVTFLIDAGLYSWSRTQMGVLIATPVLTGAVMRLPVGILCDQYGGRIVYFLLMLLSAVPMFLISVADSYVAFLLLSLGFGLSGASFAAGVAYTAAWFPQERIGTALGVFGAGNAGAAATVMFAPILLERLTATDLEGWRTLPILYSALLIAMAVVFWLGTTTRKSESAATVSMAQRLEPLKFIRVWRFGLYYAFFFGGFVALSQWLIPYYVNVYTMSIATAGFLTTMFSLPSGIIRALGGWLSDRFGARTVMYGTLIPGLVICILLIPSAMIVQTPGQGVIAQGADEVVHVSSTEIRLASGATYSLEDPDPDEMVDFSTDRTLIFPRVTSWQEPTVEVGESVREGQLLARGTTRIFFQANRWVFTVLVFGLGCALGIGMAAVYKHIPSYFPTEVGVVGGLVGVLGGLGGFVFPILFGMLLEATGLWTTSWMLLALIAAVALIWMQRVIQRMMREETGSLVRQMERPPS